MAMTRWYQTGSVLIVVGSMVAGVRVLAQQSPHSVATPVDSVKPVKLGVTVKVWGLVKAIRTTDVFNPTQGTKTIISIVPEGTRVTKGELVCEIDWAALNDQLTIQRITTAGAEAASQNARVARESAEAELGEYENITYPQELIDAKGEVEMAGNGIRNAEKHRDRILQVRKELSGRLAGKVKDRTASEIMADLYLDERVQEAEWRLARERTEFDQAKSKQKALATSTRDHAIQVHRSQISKASSVELAAKQTWSLEQRKEAKLASEIRYSKLLAPSDGIVVYANEPMRPATSSGSWIEEGASVSERQRIFRVSDIDGPLRVDLKVPEALVAWVQPGLRARIKVEELGGETLAGTVEQVAPLPDPVLGPDRASRVYPVWVTFDNRPPGVSLDMAAEVEIEVPTLDAVLVVPSPSVVYYDRKDHVAVRTSGGGFDWREVVLGLSDGALVEVKSGLKSGDLVAREPASLLSGGQKLKVSLSPPRPPIRPVSRPTGKPVHRGRAAAPQAQPR